jgi:hypothetical protein
LDEKSNDDSAQERYRLGDVLYGYGSVEEIVGAGIFVQDDSVSELYSQMSIRGAVRLGVACVICAYGV